MQPCLVGEVHVAGGVNQIEQVVGSIFVPVHQRHSLGLQAKDA